MIMEILECTVGAVDASAVRVIAVDARPAAQAARIQLLPNVRTYSLAGVGLYEVQGRDKKMWGGHRTDDNGADLGFVPTSFPTRLGPPPDHPPVN
jgi:hypothetical protein